MRRSVESKVAETQGRPERLVFFAAGDHASLRLRAVSVVYAISLWRDPVPKGLAKKLIISLTVIVVIVEGVAGIVNVKTQERDLLLTMILGADQLSKSITSATWQAMLADNRDAAYQTMKTIATNYGINQIRMYNREGQVMFSARPEDRQRVDDIAQ